MTIPSGSGQVTWVHEVTGASRRAFVTCGVDVTAFGGDATAAATALGLAWATNVMPILSSLVGLIETRVKFGPDDTGPTGVITGITWGGDSRQSGAPNSAALVNKNTAVGGRRGRGRMYIPGVPEAEVDQAGFLSSGWLSNLQAAVDGLQADMVTALLDPVLLHSGDGAPIPYPITSFTAQGLTATQRRRLRA